MNPPIGFLRCWHILMVACQEIERPTYYTPDGREQNHNPAVPLILLCIQQIRAMGVYHILLRCLFGPILPVCRE